MILVLLALHILSAVSGNLSTDCCHICRCIKDNTIVDCSNKPLSSLPDGIPKTVVTLNLKNCKIESINADGFSGLVKLKVVDLSFNALKALPKSLFDTLNVEKIYLGTNKLTEVPEAVGITSLTNLGLESNLIKNLTFPESFKKCTNLKKLAISNNPFDELTSKAFVNLQKSCILSFRMSASKVTKIQPGTFLPLSHCITSLNINNNKELTEEMIKVMLKDFSGNKPLLQLDLKGLNIMAIDDDLFKDLQGTKVNLLSLTGNPISNVTAKAFASLPYLEKLFMKSCTLKVLPDNLFIKQTKLMELNLESNHLTVFRSLTFDGLHSLTSLNASHNMLEYWEPGAMTPFAKSLVVLSLSDNALKIITGNLAVGNNIHELLTTGAKLKWLTLARNPFNCSCPDLAWFTSWLNSTNIHVDAAHSYMCKSPPDMLNHLVMDLHCNTPPAPTLIPPSKKKFWTKWTYLFIPAFMVIIVFMLCCMLIWNRRCRARSPRSEDDMDDMGDLLPPPEPTRRYDCLEWIRMKILRQQLDHTTAADDIEPVIASNPHIVQVVAPDILHDVQDEGEGASGEQHAGDINVERHDYDLVLLCKEDEQVNWVKDNIEHDLQEFEYRVVTSFNCLDVLKAARHILLFIDPGPFDLETQVFDWMKSSGKATVTGLVKRSDIDAVDLEQFLKLCGICREDVIDWSSVGRDNPFINKLRMRMF